MIQMGQEAPPFLQKLCFACGRKQHFYGSGNITQYITTTFNSPRWRPRRRPPRSSSECNYRATYGVSTCLFSRRPCCSADTGTLPAMLVVKVVVVGLPTTRTNERTNESFSHVIYNNNIRIRVFQKLLTRKIEMKICD